MHDQINPICEKEHIRPNILHSFIPWFAHLFSSRLAPLQRLCCASSCKSLVFSKLLCLFHKPKTFLWHQYKVALFCQKKFEFVLFFWSDFQVRWSSLVSKHINSQIFSFITFFKIFNLSLKTFLNSFYHATCYFLDNLVGKLNQSWKHFVRMRSTCPNIYMPCDKFLQI